MVKRRGTQALKTWFEPGSYRMAFPTIKMVLRLGGIGLLMFALLGPYVKTEEETVSIVARDIYFLLDVSASMQTEDAYPSRLEAAKTALKVLAEDLKGERMGLIVFADKAFMQCPLTLDHDAIKLFIDLADTEQFAETGTDLRTALSAALFRMLEQESGEELRSKSLVLVTDGEDFGMEFSSVVNRLEQAQVKVFPVGVGSYEGANVPQIVQGKRRGFLQREDGTTVFSQLKDENLKALAKRFGTEYLHLQRPEVDVKSLADEIRLLAPSEIDDQRQKVENDRYQVFLLLGILFLTLSLFLMPIRR